jgi:hypothetical protein
MSACSATRARRAPGASSATTCSPPPLLAAAALAAFATWLAGLVFILVYAYAWTLPPDSLLGHGLSGPPAHLRRLGVPLDVWLTVAGIALLAAAPRITAAVADVDATLARTLLGRSRAEELAHRVEHLTQTRTGALDAADAERRRLERDLHDGTQQRLVALAMRLGMARVEPADAAQAHQVIAEAHEDAKAALAELRNLIRGLHPAVLEDRGLDAALSGVAARMAIPVRTCQFPAERATVLALGQRFRWSTTRRILPADRSMVSGSPTATWTRTPTWSWTWAVRARAASARCSSPSPARASTCTVSSSR